MCGADVMQESMFTTVILENYVPKDHPLRPTRLLFNEALKQLHGRFESIHAEGGRDSIAPKKLLRAQLLQVLYSIRSERLLVEQLRYNLLVADHFSVFGTLIQAWASQNSFVKKDNEGTPPLRAAVVMPSRIFAVKRTITIRRNRRRTAKPGCTRRATAVNHGGVIWVTA